MSNHHIAAALRKRSFIFLWLAEILSQIAMNMLNFILILVAYQLSTSNTVVSGIVLAFTIPAVIFGLLAGVYVDRWNKKTVLFVTNFLRASVLALLALFHNNLFALYAATFAVSMITQFFIPAETPMIPQLVENDLLYSANALFGVGLYGAMLIAYGLSGPFLLLFQATDSFLALSGMFLLAAVCILFIQHAKKGKATKTLKTITVIYEMKSTINTIVKTKELYSSFVLLIVIQILILIVSVLGPGYAQHILGIQVAQFPLLFVTPAVIGMILGAVLITHFLHDYPKERSARIGIFTSAAALFLLPYGSKVASRAFVQTLNQYLPHTLQITILHIMVVLAFVMGFAIACMFVPSNTIIQERTSDEVRGKIYGTLNSIAALCSIIPVAVVGTLADVFGVSAVLVAVGCSIFLVGIIHIFFHS